MRAIKFRAWDTKLKQFVDLTESEYSLEVMAQGDVKVIRQGRPINDSRFLLLQFTGLKDAKEKEIYEGDVVKCRDNVTDIEKGIVEWGTDGWIIRAASGSFKGLCDWGTPVLEIIGNIYENPELLTL